MTREEAIEVMKAYRDKVINSASNQLDGDIEALDMAIKALSQEPCDECRNKRTSFCGNCKYYDEYEPCDDAISREWLMRKATERFYTTNYFNHITAMIEEAPSVTQKSGKWQRVSIDKYIQHAMAYYECSECGSQTIGEPKFCPNCGAKMVEPQESEE